MPTIPQNGECLKELFLLLSIHRRIFQQERPDEQVVGWYYQNYLWLRAIPSPH